VTEHVHNLALQFAERGHDVQVITSNMEEQTADAPFVRRLGTSRVVFRNGSFARITTGFRLTSRLRDMLREFGADLVHVHGGLAPPPPTFGLAAPSAADKLGIPAIATYHSWFRHSMGYTVFKRPLQKRLDRLAANIAVSQPVIDALSRYFTTDWHVIPNGINIQYFHPNGRKPHDAFTRDRGSCSSGGSIRGTAWTRRSPRCRRSSRPTRRARSSWPATVL